MSAFDRLLQQIDAFIKKYYKNQMVKGLIWFVGFFLFSFLLVSTLEYFGQFGKTIRGILFFGFIIVNGYLLFQFILKPLFKLFQIGNRINRYQASDIIGQFFPDISDRLKNTLQLNDDENTNVGSLELLRASVAQRSESLSVVPFSNAIQLKENYKYLKYVLPIVLFFCAVLIFVPKLITQSTNRVVNYSEDFVPVAPFNFDKIDFNNEIVEGEDLKVGLILNGNALPEKVYIIDEQGKYLMNKTKGNAFEFVFQNRMKSGTFQFQANGFNSEVFDYKVLTNGIIGKFDAELVYPDYLKKEAEVIVGAGDLMIPEGTVINWSVLGKNTEQIVIQTGGKSEVFNKPGFSFTKKFFANDILGVFVKGTETQKVDSSLYEINVIKDRFPMIQVKEEKDSLRSGIRRFSGLVRDDYGLTNLSFVYTITNKGGNERSERLNVMPVGGVELPFQFAVDLNREKLAIDDKVEYHFEVKDNDGVNGSKTTRSETFVYELPSLEELNDKREKEQEETKEDLSKLLKDSEQFQKKVEKLKKDLINSKSSSWNKSEQVKQLLEEQKSLLNQLSESQEKLSNSLEEKNQLTEMDQELLDKQEMINELLEELMDDELRDLLEQLQKLLEENRMNEAQELMEEVDQSSEDLNKQLDRSLEMLKKLQVDEKIDALEEELKKLAEDQLDLKEKQEENKGSKEENAKEQDEIEKRFDELKEDLKVLEKLNEELERPMELNDPEDNEKKIDVQLQDAKESLEKGKNKQAGEKQSGAASEMKKLADELDAAQASSNQKQQEEDIESLREILESLVALSLDQEWVNMEFNSINGLDPKYRSLGRFQRKIMDNTVPVRDSLMALAKRQPKIATFVDKELHLIEVNLGLGLEDIDERRMRNLDLHQQLAMTSYNNLALLLNESLQQMQSQMQNMMKGSGSCDNPGGSGMPKPGDGMSPGNMKEMLKKQLESMEKGPSPGGKKPGDKDGEGSTPGGMSNKQIAKIAAEQSAIRKQLEQLRKELNKDGSGNGNKLNPLINELEKQEEDLVNKRLGNNLIQRQKEILTRLLESEKALMERGLDEKRESSSGKNENYGNKISFEEYNNQKLKQMELLRTTDPNYNKYYIDKATQFFNGAW